VVMYFRQDEETIPRRIEIEMRRNLVIRLPASYYNIVRKTIHNPITNLEIPLRLSPVVKVYKHRSF